MGDLMGRVYGTDDDPLDEAFALTTGGAGELVLCLRSPPMPKGLRWQPIRLICLPLARM